MRVYGVVGWKNAGKTGLMERLVAEITGRGFTVSTVKHAHHTFDVDHPGKDSHRHRVAGAREVLLASGARFALMHELRGYISPMLVHHIGNPLVPFHRPGVGCVSLGWGASCPYVLAAVNNQRHAPFGTVCKVFRLPIPRQCQLREVVAVGQEYDPVA